MNEPKYFEVTAELVIGSTKSGRDKKQKEVYLVNAQTVTEAEARVVQDFENSGVNIDYKISGAKQSRIIGVIE